MISDQPIHTTQMQDDIDAVFALTLEPRLERGTGLMAKIEQVIVPEIEALGYRLVRVSLFGQHKPTLQIMAEPQDGSLMGIEGCRQISETLSLVLDVEDPLTEAYRLEVSSPGLDRPLTCPYDFTLYYGYEARLELSILFAERRRFRGVLQGWSANQSVLIECEGMRYAIPYAHILRAKLVSNDSLAKAAMNHKLPRWDRGHPLYPVLNA